MKPNFLNELSHGLQAWFECSECDHVFGYLTENVDEEPEWCPACGEKGELVEVDSSILKKITKVKARDGDINNWIKTDRI